MYKTLAPAIGVAAFLQVFSAQAQEFKPFAPSSNVCPTCKVEGLDRIILKNGQEVDALVVAENTAFYVLERNREWRPVAKALVASVHPFDANKHGPVYVDQILFKDGVVFIGKIIRERDDTGMFEIQLPETMVNMFGYKSQIAAVYKGGNLYWSAPAK